MLTIHCVVKQSITGSNDDITVMHHRYVAYFPPVTSWYRSQPLEVAVIENHYTLGVTAKPELVVDDTKGADVV